MKKSKLALTMLCTSLPVFMHCMTPNEQLLEAAKYGQLQQAQDALDAGADVNYQQNTMDSTALHQAAYHGHKNIVKLLLNKDAAVTILNSHNLTPLHCVSSVCPQVIFNNGKSSDRVKIAKLLLAAGTNVNIQNSFGETALHRAVLCDQIDIVKLLIENGARDLKNKSNKTALEIAKEYYKKKMIKLLATIRLLATVPSLKHLSAWTIVDLIKQNKLTLEQVRNSIPEELYEFVTKRL